MCAKAVRPSHRLGERDDRGVHARLLPALDERVPDGQPLRSTRVEMLRSPFVRVGRRGEVPVCREIFGRLDECRSGARVVLQRIPLVTQKRRVGGLPVARGQPAHDVFVQQAALRRDHGAIRRFADDRLAKEERARQCSILAQDAGVTRLLQRGDDRRRRAARDAGDERLVKAIAERAAEQERIECRRRQRSACLLYFRSPARRHEHCYRGRAERALRQLDRRARIPLCRHNDLAQQVAADRGVRFEQAADEQLDGLFFERIDRTIASRRCPAKRARLRRDGSDERETPHLRHNRDRLEGAQIVRSGEMRVVNEYGDRLMLDERGKLSYLRSKILPGKGCGAAGGAEHFDRRLDLRALAKQARFSASARSGENRNRAGAECGVVKQAVKVGQLLLASYAVLGFGSSRMMGRQCPYKLRFGNYIILLFPIGGMRNV